MKREFTTALITVLASLAGITSSANELVLHHEPFALVELFTSEGCSSCPPAEANLNTIHRDAETNGQRVFALAFHVDYWNRLGWVDPFSDSAYSQRQRRYAQAWGLRTIYTPQMIVSGSAEFVGSDRREAKQQIKNALDTKNLSPLGIGLAVAPDSVVKPGEAVQIQWQIDRLPHHAELHLVLVEDGLTTDVPRGENRGRALHHDAVVRDWARSTLDDELSGHSELHLPASLMPDQAAIVGFVQDPDTMQILAAHRIPLTDMPGSK